MTKETNKAYTFKDFVIYVLGFDILLILMLGYPVYNSYGVNSLYSGILGVGIISLNFLASYYIIQRFSSLSGGHFVNVVLASMAVRLFLLILIIIAVILFINIDRFSFIISLFISYISKSVIEIYFLSKNSQVQRLKTTSD